MTLELPIDAVTGASPIMKMVVGEVIYDRMTSSDSIHDGANTSTRPMPSRSESAAPPHVLVVEDDTDLLELFGAHMRRLGCTVSLAKNGYEALQSVEDRAPDVAVVDILLPDLDGRVVVGALRQNELTANCRIVITSVLDPADISAASDAVLAKPFDRVDVDRVFRPLLAEFGFGH